MTETARSSTWRELRQLLRLPTFRKLFAVRLVSQISDGMFQVGLASLLFFSPESMGTAAGVAAGFAVMLAPFTIVGPFAGVLLDRWSRRQILFVGNLIRAAITATMALTYAAAGEFVLINILGLAALSVNRFLLAGLSAGLPKTISDDCANLSSENCARPSQQFSANIQLDAKGMLLTANSLVPTFGAGAAFLGGAIGFLLASLPFNASVSGNAVVLFGSAIMMVAASLITTRLGKIQLGPEVLPTDTFRQAVSKVARDLGSAGHYLRMRVTPFQGLLATAIHRFLFGLVFISAILMSRNLLAGAGLGVFAIIMGLIGAGGAISVVITPLLSRTMGPQRWVGVMFLVAAAAMLLLSVSPSRWIVFAAALILGVGSQGSKIAVDTIVQRDTADQYRGRAFAFYDVIFNAAFVAAAALAAFIVPDAGWSRWLFWGLAFCYTLTALWMYFRSAKEPVVSIVGA